MGFKVLSHPNHDISMKIHIFLEFLSWSHTGRGKNPSLGSSQSHRIPRISFFPLFSLCPGPKIPNILGHQRFQHIPNSPGIPMEFGSRLPFPSWLQGVGIPWILLLPAGANPGLEQGEFSWEIFGISMHGWDWDSFSSLINSLHSFSAGRKS